MFITVTQYNPDGTPDKQAHIDFDDASELIDMDELEDDGFCCQEDCCCAPGAHCNIDLHTGPISLIDDTDGARRHIIYDPSLADHIYDGLFDELFSILSQDGSYVIHIEKE